MSGNLAWNGTITAGYSGAGVDICKCGHQYSSHLVIVSGYRHKASNCNACTCPGFRFPMVRLGSLFPHIPQMPLQLGTQIQWPWAYDQVWTNIEVY